MGVGYEKKTHGLRPEIPAALCNRLLLLPSGPDKVHDTRRTGSAIIAHEQHLVVTQRRIKRK